MKKLFLTTLTILTCGACYALPVGNPSDAGELTDGVLWEGRCSDPCDPCQTLCDAFSLRVGFYGDYVFNRHLEIDRHQDGSDIEHTQLFTNAGYLAANLWDRVELFTTLGATNFFIDTNAFAFGGLNQSRFEIESETGFSWSLGVRGTIIECGCTSLGAEAQYFFAHPDIRRVTEGGVVSVYPDAIIDAKYREWQVGLGITHRINILAPYVAVKWSKAKMHFDNARPGEGLPEVTLFDLENKKHWGFAAGVSIVACEKASLTVEGRFGDEKAVHVNGQLRF